MAKRILSLFLGIGVVTCFFCADIFAQDDEDFPPERPRIDDASGIKQLKHKNIKTSAPCKFIVGIGASTGSLNAIKDILKSLPRDLDMAYILVQHPDSKYVPITTKDISAMTKTPVIKAKDKTKVERNKFYVISSGAIMSIADNVFRDDSGAQSRDQHMPIDHFFVSLAKEQTSRGIGVLLSGDTSDGVLGLTEIVNSGGRAYVQNAETAEEHNKMAASAIASGVVSSGLSPESIGRELRMLSEYPEGERGVTVFE